jgi:hypothetical protein
MGRKKKEPVKSDVPEVNDMPLCECDDFRSHHAVFSSVEFEMLSKKYSHFDNPDLFIMRVNCFMFQDKPYTILEETENCKMVSYRKSK